ncbi:hypothetical protein [Roseimaritima multifibrata]|uniref:hypothetical protein n=1 Tax=Roseimaritima multifibrata TaxID=1930274 RepID=UPI00119E97E1|nr:hypothetical protein [Roseimaritima multifibrata]
MKPFHTERTPEKTHGVVRSHAGGVAHEKTQASDGKAVTRLRFDLVLLVPRQITGQDPACLFDGL